MAVSFQHARQFMGQPVCAHCREGKKYYGVVQNVTKKGVLLRPFPGQPALASGKQASEITTADKPGILEGENIFLGFLLPFVSLFSLSPYAGYGGGYGYGGPRPYGYGAPYGYGGFGGYGYGGPGPYGAFGYPRPRPGFWF